MKNENAIEKKQEKKAVKKVKEKKPGLFSKLVRYFKDLKGEFKKIVWPSKKQVLNNTLVAVGCMAVVAALIFVLDWLFITVFSLIY